MSKAMMVSRPWSLNWPSSAPDQATCALDQYFGA